MLRRILGLCGIARVQCWDAEASTVSIPDKVVGTVWPWEVGAVASGPTDVLCVGPREWLVVDQSVDGPALFETLANALEGGPLTATDVSQGLTRVEVTGPHVREFLLKGCSLDLHPDRFPAGRCARVRFAGIPAVLRCHDASTFEAIVAASYREYWLAWLADASS